MNKQWYRVLFPGKKSKALTLSYDDGVLQDRRLVAILNEWGLKGTFNLNAGLFGFSGQALVNGKETDVSRLGREEAARLYSRHEIAGHGLWHSSLPHIGSAAAMREIIEDKRLLEELSGRILDTFAYPFGTQSPEIHALLEKASYRCARTVAVTHGFDLPEHAFQWDTTCHHDDPELMGLAETFCTARVGMRNALLFSLWGHSYEFDANDNWRVMETFARYMGGFSKEIWFATNGEVFRYLQAWRGLRFSADGRTVQNPSATAVCLANWQDEYEIPGGVELRLGKG